MVTLKKISGFVQLDSYYTILKFIAQLLTCPPSSRQELPSVRLRY